MDTPEYYKKSLTVDYRKRSGEPFVCYSLWYKKDGDDYCRDVSPAQWRKANLPEDLEHAGQAYSILTSELQRKHCKVNMRPLLDAREESKRQGIDARLSTVTDKKRFYEIFAKCIKEYEKMKRACFS